MAAEQGDQRLLTFSIGQARSMLLAARFAASANPPAAGWQQAHAEMDALLEREWRRQQACQDDAVRRQDDA